MGSGHILSFTSCSLLCCLPECLPESLFITIHHSFLSSHPVPTFPFLAFFVLGCNRQAPIKRLIPKTRKIQHLPAVGFLVIFWLNRWQEFAHLDIFLLVFSLQERRIQKVTCCLAGNFLSISLHDQTTCYRMALERQRKGQPGVNRPTIMSFPC